MFPKFRPRVRVHSPFRVEAERHAIGGGWKNCATGEIRADAGDLIWSNASQNRSNRHFERVQIIRWILERSVGGKRLVAAGQRTFDDAIFVFGDRLCERMAVPNVDQNGARRKCSKINADNVTLRNLAFHNMLTNASSKSGRRHSKPSSVRRCGLTRWLERRAASTKSPKSMRKRPAGVRMNAGRFKTRASVSANSALV